MKSLRLPFLAVLASVALASTDDSAYELLWKPKADDLLEYRLELDIDVQSFKFKYNTDVEMKVLKVDGNGDYELHTSTKNTRIRFQDDEEMIPDEEPEATVEKFNARGERLGPKTEDEGAEANPVGKLLSQVTEFVAPNNPVKKGEKWSKEPKDGSGRMQYEVVGTEGSGDSQIVRIDYTYEDPAGNDSVKAAGTYRLRRSDFSISDFEAVVENFRMDKDAPLGKARLSMKRL